MWYLLLVIVFFVIGKFLYNLSEQRIKVAKQGGMINKYNEVINLLLNGDSNSRIYNSSIDSITVGSSSGGSSVFFILTHTFGKLHIQWNLNSHSYGKHNLEWTFPEFADQYKMVEKMLNDVNIYQTNVVTAQINYNHNLNLQSELEKYQLDYRKKKLKEGIDI